MLTVRYLGDLTDDEIASTLSVCPATIRTRVDHARTLLAIHVVILYAPDEIVPGPAGWDLMMDDIEATHDDWQL